MQYVPIPYSISPGSFSIISITEPTDLHWHLSIESFPSHHVELKPTFLISWRPDTPWKWQMPTGKGEILTTPMPHGHIPEMQNKKAISTKPKARYHPFINGFQLFYSSTVCIQELLITLLSSSILQVKKRKGKKKKLVTSGSVY